MKNKEIIEQFLISLGGPNKGQFWFVCGNCGAADQVKDHGGDSIEYSSYGVYGTEYTGHMWDDVSIKCKKCGNAFEFST